MNQSPPAKKQHRPRFVRSDMIGLCIINREVDTSVARVFVWYPEQGTIKIEYFEPDQRPNAYETWLSVPRGRLAAMRNAGEVKPLYHHDFVDVH